MNNFFKGTYEQSDCSDGWLAFEDNCYYTSDEKLNWWEAEEKCAQTAGGHLASCFSGDQADFLASIVAEGEKYYVGYNDL